MLGNVLPLQTNKQTTFLTWQISFFFLEKTTSLLLVIDA